MRRRGDWGNARRVHNVAENSTDDETTVEKLAEKRKRLWARRENNGDEAGGRENGCTL
jgi:hypothetical protein